ncbi:MAG TPA: P-loop NTPase fold protein [Nitrospinota bacterium]|nr:P-loop NTPase fold protein [Nitrospinota bacterium]|tara:strand:+ start:1733 stop:4027 length:2295 start_codon:yes stop_codon:yes gene_type:complete
MFIYDKPIETEKDDFLGRKRFSKHLGKALLDWKEKESLVIAIYGEWGSGKSSVINLATENIEKSNHENKPTIIEFNPWIFSEEDSLGEHFFNEIAKELEIRNDTEKDKKIAKKLKFYASLLSLTPEENLLACLSSKALLVFGLIGISSSQIISWLNIPGNWIQNALLIGGSLLVLVELFKGYLAKLANYFDKKAAYYSKSISEVKREIKKELIDRQKKLVVVIDDLDRLNQSEIRQIFRLIRVNADFPNTIYLLAFDRKIIEKNLEEQVGVSGQDYLNKIVQVNFEVPFAKPSKISTFLFKELDRILNVLPGSAQKYFGQDDPYWANIYHSGFKDFFKNIRDVKRFASSLEFNISQMYQGEVMEVNPIDFIAIEAIRIFAPDFYLFMRTKCTLFTSTDSNNTSSSDNDPRKDEIEKALIKLPNETKESVLELIKRLFPQVDGLFQYGYSSHGHEWQSTWSNTLRVCATNNFDSYFTLIPGGDEEELSQFEIEDILNKSKSEEEFEKILREYIDKGKIRKVLERIQDFTDDQTRISQTNVKNVVKGLFNISDDLPEEKAGMLDFGANMDIMRIIYQLLKRETDKNKNFELLKEVIPSSKGIFGPLQKVSLESSIKEEGKDSDEFLVPKDEIEELKKLCLEKIIGSSTDDLIKHKNLHYILYRWKEWDKEEKWKDFIKEITANDTKLLLFIATFVTKSKSQTIGDYGVKVTKKFNYKSLNDFIDLSEIKLKLEEIKKQDSQLYKNNKEAIELFLDNFENKDKGDWD